MNLKPWPTETVMIIAYVPQTAPTDKMERIVPSPCRGCGCRTIHDGAKYRRVWKAPWRNGRPIEFLCEYCAAQFDLSAIPYPIAEVCGSFDLTEHLATKASRSTVDR